MKGCSSARKGGSWETVLVNSAREPDLQEERKSGEEKLGGSPAVWPQGGRVRVLSRAVFLSAAGGKAAAPREEATPGGGEQHPELSTSPGVSGPPGAGSGTTKIRCMWNQVCPLMNGKHSKREPLKPRFFQTPGWE